MKFEIILRIGIAILNIMKQNNREKNVSFSLNILILIMIVMFLLVFILIVVLMYLFILVENICIMQSERNVKGKRTF